jgi:uncharacterized membrane protein
MASRDLFTGAALGAGLVWFLDPDRGAERRHRAVTRVGEWLQLGQETAGAWRGHYGARLGDLAGLEAANLPGGRASSGLGTVGLALLGGALTVYGLTRRGSRAVVARTVGAGLLARRARHPSEHAGTERRRVVDIQKSIHIAAPVTDVFGFWDSYESFPLFLSSVREVDDLGGGRSRWIVAGPGGSPIEWETVLTHRIPGRLLAWQSEPGSMLHHAGAIRFTPDQGGTRVDLRLCYQPPAGGADRTVAELLGADPRARLNDDLARLRSVLESTVRREGHGQEHRS